jgi:hypothetical protein
MQFFYDGQIRRYLTQIIRLLSNFVVRHGDGTLVRIPVMYGDPDKQAANIINQNSENTIPSVPRIAVYITEYDLNRNRIQEPTFISKIHLRERAIEVDDDGNEYYTSAQGRQVTVERMMPTPFDLTVKVDIWSSNTEQKLQILEQILVLFNPSLEIQTTDNFIDWTSLSVVELEDVNFSSRSIPTGTNSSIDIASITLKTPTWLSPPVKVKKLGVVTSVISNLYTGIDPGIGDYLEGFGIDPAAYERSPVNFEFTQYNTVGNFEIEVTNNTVRMFGVEKGEDDNLPWDQLLMQFPGTFRNGLSKLFLLQKDQSVIVGTLSRNPLDPTLLSVTWDIDSYHSNNYIDENGNIENIDTDYDPNTGRGTFDAVINPQTFNPKRPNGEPIDQPIAVGVRYLLVENCGGGLRETFLMPRASKYINTGEIFSNINHSQLVINGIVVSHIIQNSNGKCQIKTNTTITKNSIVTYVLNYNEDGPDAWKNLDGSDTIAFTNDIIMWSGTEWKIIFDAQTRVDDLIYQTNYFTGTQYKWNGINWVKSFEGDYGRGSWRIQL